jgi:hypothetical protein
LYLASEFAEQYSYDYGENLTAALEANGFLSDEERKRQMIADFQNELTRTYMEIDHADRQKQLQQRAEYQRYQDILDGIIVL